MVAIVSIVNKLGDDLDLYVDQGGFIALTSVAFVFDMIGAIYWTATWFVDARNTSFKRRLRTEKEHGNWYGIFYEVRRDLKRPVIGQPEDDMEQRLITKVGSNQQNGYVNNPGSRFSAVSGPPNASGGLLNRFMNPFGIGGQGQVPQPRTAQPLPYEKRPPVAAAGSDI